MASEKYTNLASTLLSAAITTTGATNLSVASSAGFPTAQFRIRIDNELMIVTAITGTTWTVTRGAEGSIAATHASGAVVTHILTAGALDQMVADECQQGSLGSRPAAEKTGRIYLPSYALADNAGVAWRDTGTVWSPFGPNWNLQPPNDSTFSWVAQLGCATSQVAGGPVNFHFPAGNGVTNLAARVKNLPAAPYDIVMAFSACWLAGNNEAGIVLYDGISKMVAARVLSFTQGSNAWGGNFNSPNSFNSNVTASQVGYVWQGAPLMWIRLSDDNTNWKMYASCDGLNWLPVWSVARNTFITPTQYGYYVNNASNQESSVTIWHFTP